MLETAHYRPGRTRLLDRSAGAARTHAGAEHFVLHLDTWAERSCRPFLQQAEVFAVDISDDALTLAKENSARLGLSARVRFQKGDLLENLNERFDLIVANLPYVSMQHKNLLAREVLHDPEVALFAGPTGEELMRRLIEQAPQYLEPHGLLALEIGINQSEGLADLLRQKNYHDIQSKKDYAGITRFLLARYG